MTCTATNHRLLIAALGLAAGLVVVTTAAQAPDQAANVAKDTPTVFSACYIPTTGLMYRIKAEGLSETCRAESHVAFSWSATPAVQQNTPDSLRPLFAPPVYDVDGIAWVGTLHSGSIPIEGAGVRMLWYPRKAAFRVGEVTGDRWDNNNIGFRSFAMGMNTIASKSSAMALGSGTQATARRAVAIGYLAKATGENAVAMGNATTASGETATALGHKTTASGVYATALGINTIASGPYSLAANGVTIASGPFATALGKLTEASGWYATALGYSTTASAHKSTAMGEGTTASSYAATAAGVETTASQYAATALGWKTVASGVGSTALGKETNASFYYATALGNHTVASGASSAALGFYTTASGEYTTALGSSTVAQAQASLVLGRWNVPEGSKTQWVEIDPVLVIGNGTSTSNRNNAFEVLKNGNTTIDGDLTIIGSCTGCSSDENLKQNIRPLEDALERIGQLTGVAYDWRDDVREAEVYPGPQIGVLGQEVERVFPELVGTDSRGYKYVRYQKLVAPLIEAVKELKAQKDAEIAALRAEKDAQDARIAKLEAALQRVERARVATQR